MCKRIFMGLCLVILAGAGMSWAQGCFYDDAAFFSTNAVKPNVFIMLDHSGSMCWDPASSGYPCSGYYGAACQTSPYYYSACDAPQFGTNLYGNCSKIHLATQALFGVLDADSNGTVQDQDSLALKVRVGYGEFYNSMGEGSGEAIPYNNDTIGTKYSKIWADLSQEGVCDGTPLNEATWLSKELVRTTHIREGSGWACRKSFVIVITDGNDTWGCYGGGSGGSPQQRRASVDVCYTSFKNDSIPVYVIGFPDQHDAYQTNVLNWMAYCGGTRASPPVGDTMCYIPHNMVATYTTCDNFSGVDPGNCPLSGCAYFATNAVQLKAALKAIFQQVSQSSGSTFSPPSVPANFTASSMLLVNNFDAQTYPLRWRGHLQALAFYPGGGIPVFGGGGLDTNQRRWDAGNILRKRDVHTDNRTIYTAFQQPPAGYALYQLNDTARIAGHIKPDSLGFASGRWDSLGMMVNYMYYDSTSGSAKYGWLGDPFHAGPIDVGYPNPYFSTDTLYSTFAYNLHITAPRPRRVYLQANDGMLHMFKADSSSLDSSSGGGRELWALVPAHVRPWLRDMLYSHDYNLDGPIISTNILVPGLTTSGQVKWQDWRTLLVAGERTGGRDYYALDITHPDSSGYPKFLWQCGPATNDNSGTANGDPAMGFTFGMATVCRVKDSTGGAPYERYVAFLPGGYDCGNIGRGNFILALDAYTGKLLKKITLPGGNFGIAAPVRPVDVNYDGYVDRLYVGDMSGDVWRIILDNPFPYLPGPGYSAWHATKFFHPSIAGYSRPIFGQVSVAANYSNALYIMWGTGDRNHPTVPDSQRTDAFFGVQDADTGAPFNMGQLSNSSNCTNPGIFGWYVNLYNSATNYSEVYTNAVTVSDSVRALAWTPSSSQTNCTGAGAGSDTLVSFYYTCGYNPGKVTAGTGIPPYSLGWGVDNQGNVTALLPNLHKMTLGTLNRGKFIRVWREIY